MSRIDYQQVRAALNPFMHMSPDRLPSSHTTRFTRHARIMSISKLRPFSPPNDPSQRQCMAWAMGDDDIVLVGVLCAGIMLHSVVMRKLLVAGPLRDQLLASIGLARLADSLRYEGGDQALMPGSCDENFLKTVGFAVMYRYVRTVSVELSRRLLRRMAKDDPRLGLCITWVRRIRREKCEAIGAIAMDICHLHVEK